MLNKEERLAKSRLPKFVPKALKDIYQFVDEETDQFVEREKKIYYVLKTIEKTLNEFL